MNYPTAPATLIDLLRTSGRTLTIDTLDAVEDLLDYVDDKYNEEDHEEIIKAYNFLVRVVREFKKKLPKLSHAEMARLAAENKDLRSRVANAGPVTITIKDEKTGKVKKVSSKDLGYTHKQFATAVKYVSARNEQGYPVPTWFYGNAGGGKSHMFRQIAQQLGYEEYTIRGLGPTDTLGSIVGYKNHLTGEFVPGAITPEMYGKGGFVAFDEVCNSDPSVPIGLNDLVAGIDYKFANGQTVKKSKNFTLVASDNTNGLGSKGGFIRSKLDVSSLTRFAFFRLEYDNELEVKLSGNPKWTAYVQKAREFASKSAASAPVFITPRASINGAALLRAGIPIPDVLDSTLFTHCGPDVRDTIVAAIGTYTE